MEDTTNIALDPEQDEIMLPEGGIEDGDLFGADEQPMDPETEKEENPTTDSPEVGGDTGTEDEPAPTTEPADDVPHKLKFTAKVDRADLDVEVEESELPTLYQKAQVTDRLQSKLEKLSPMLEKSEKLAKSMGFKTVDEMLESAEESFHDSEVAKLVAEGVHEEVAKDVVDHRMERRATIQAPAERDFAAEVETLMTERPELKGTTIPAEVAKACAEGKSLLTAYDEYEIKQTKTEAERLKQENKILRQNATNAAQAPVGRVSGGGETDTKPTDDFMTGFNSDD